MMQPGDAEEDSLRNVALQNAQSILQARERAEEELIRAKDALELKTRELAHSLAMMRATLEATTDGVLMTDGRGRITGYNENFLRLWNLPPEAMQDQDHFVLSRRIAVNFANPAAFQARIEEIYARSPVEAFDLLQFANGRIVERFSRLQVIDGLPVGRVWSLRDITERRRAEAMLKQQAEWHRIMVSSIGDGVITTDTAGRVTSLNPVAELLTGWTDSDALGLPLTRIFNIVNEQSREAAENPALRSLREGRVTGLGSHTLLIAKDGTERMIDDSAAPIIDEAGKILGVVLIFRDVTERRRGEAANLHLAAVVGSSDDAIISKSLEGIISSWNAGATRIFGYTAEEIVGKSITVLMPPERVPEEEDILRRLRRGERLENFETVRRHKQGWRIDVSVTASVIRDSQGRVIGVSKIARDITHRKREEQAARFLADASAALTDLGDHERNLRKVAHLAVASFADLCIVDLCTPERSVRRLEVTHSEHIAPDLAEAVRHHSPQQRFDTNGVARVLRTGESVWVRAVPDAFLKGAAQNDDHLSTLRQMGVMSYICVALRARTGVIGALTFVTSKLGRIYEASDLRAAEDLANRAGIAIDNANLLKALQDSDQRKDEFLAMLAHELRNPLAPIRNAAHIIQAKASRNPDVEWATGLIDRQVDQMTRLIDDLLDVSRITRGKIKLRKESIEIAALLHSVLDAARPLTDKRGHQLTVTLPREPIRLQGDFARLSQILVNLLDNAAKYTDPNGQIWLVVEPEEQEVVIRVRDTGIGIPADMLPRVFDMFTQVDRSLERSQGGLGIGLMLVRRLAELHGGSIEAHSDGVGTGSEFVLRLPRGSRPELATD